MPHWKTAIATLVIVASLTSCRRSSPESSETPDRTTTPPTSVPARPSEQSAAGDDFDIGSVAATLEPLLRCDGTEVLWGDACASAPDVLSQLASKYPIPPELRECGASLMPCQHAPTLCELPSDTLVGDAGQSILVVELADALYTYGENGLSRKCSIRYPGGCEEFSRYPKTSPDCPSER